MFPFQLLLSLLWSLVKVHSQTEYPHVSFTGETLPNHGYVDLSLVGDPETGGDSVQCVTDLATCCSSAQYINGVVHRGDWFFPNGNQMRFSSGGDDIYQQRGAQHVDLRRRNNVFSPSGIYHCYIATNAVHADHDNYVREIVYVGLYGSGGIIIIIIRILTFWYDSLAGSSRSFCNAGDIIIPGGMSLAVNSDLNGASPQFILTCISTGGPATTVTWTRDSVTVTEGTETVFNTATAATTAEYTHTLTVTGRLGGLYTCTVANDKPSNASAIIVVTGLLSHLITVLNLILPRKFIKHCTMNSDRCSY